MNFPNQKIVCLALIFLLSANVRCGCAEVTVEPLTPEEDADMVKDVTHGLTDAEIDSALSDLNFNDMSALSNLIDATDIEDDNYVEGSFIDSNARSPAFMPPALNSMIAQIEAQSNLDNTPLDDPQNLDMLENYDRLQPRLDTCDPYEENTREKREDAQGETPAETQQVVDEEYIRQLEDSFPRDQGEMEIEDPDGKKEHIRVKRTEDIDQFCPAPIQV